MPKLIQINAAANCGSTGKIAEQIGSLARDVGWDTYLIHGARYAATTKMNSLKVVSPLGEVLHDIKSIFFDAHGLGSTRATKKIIQKIDLIKPDVIHLHNIHGYYINYKILFKYLNSTNIKIIWTFHDFWPITGHCTHFEKANCTKWEIECNNCPLSHSYPKSYIDFSKRNYKLKKKLFTSNKNLQIVCVSEWLAKLVRRSFFKEFNIHVINNGIELSIFKPTIGFIHDNIKPNDFVILGVASKWKNGAKGFNDYITLSKMLEKNEKIILVGVDDDIIKKLPENVIGIKRTNNQNELVKIYSRANAVTSLSPQETFGMTIIEGYACGTPAVVYDNTAPPSLITKETGFVVPNKSVPEVYEALKIIKKNGKQHYHEKCVSIAKELYDKDKCFYKYISLYERITCE